MTRHGDDCYFYYYSTCTKGDSCPFRHCEAAKQTETVCSFWQEGRCFRPMCKFRHMEIPEKKILCHLEKQPAGCKNQAKRTRQEDELSLIPSQKKARNTVESQETLGPAAPPQKTSYVRKIPVKTLDEIRRERSARLQVQQASQEKKILCHLEKQPAGCKNQVKRTRQEDEPSLIPSSKKARDSVESQETLGPAAPSQKSSDIRKIRVKTLEEIRREKSARLQVQQASQVVASSSVVVQPSSTVLGSPSSLLEAGSTSDPLRAKLNTISIPKTQSLDDEIDGFLADYVEDDKTLDEQIDEFLADYMEEDDDMDIGMEDLMKQLWDMLTHG